METIHVALGEHAYNIEIAAGLLDKIGPKVVALLPKARRAVIISDTNVAPLYAERLQKTMAAADIPAELITFPAGEQSKNLTVFSQVLEKIAELGLTRSDVVLTLGGGVVGDLGGYAAASYMRGVAFIQIPTSLLAQIDSSVGGKVAVDLKAGKNLAGVFYQPKAVFIDTDLLKTLPVHFLHDGLAEAIKYGAILDAALFERIAGFSGDEELLENIDSIVANCCSLKARIVEQDEFDTGLRGLLNFGHTMGHAIEQYYGFSTFTHGEGVGIGMYQLTQRTEEKGITPKGSAARIKAALEKYSLPTEPGVDKSLLLDGMSRDKKKNGNTLTIIVLEEIGRAVLKKLAWQEVPEYLG